MNSTVIALLRLSSFFIFIGKAWQYFFWDTPLRSFFWDEEILSPFLNILGYKWEEYASGVYGDTLISLFAQGLGLMFTLCALLSLIVYKRDSIKIKIIRSGGFSLLLLALLQCKQSFWQLGMFTEATLQFMSPFLLVWSLQIKDELKSFALFIKVLIAFTFISHGAYAYGLHPVPASFIDMCIQFFSLSELQALQFLKVAGVMDLVCSVCLFIPVVGRFFLIPIMGWGLLTALARVVVNTDSNFLLVDLSMWGYETISRLPHFIVPLALFIFLKEFKSVKMFLGKTALVFK